jgi:hypothetical protein
VATSSTALAVPVGSSFTTSVTGFTFSSVSASTNVLLSPGEGRVSGAAPSAGVSVPSTRAGLTGIVPTTNFEVISSRLAGGAAPGATVIA